MIFISSVSADTPLPCILTYSATKSFCTYMGEGLNFEFKDTIDVISYRPASVDTNMNPDRKVNNEYITPERSA